MAGAEFSEQTGDADEHAGGMLAGCNAGDLRALLTTIVDQIAEADRRHSDTLQQLQDRLAGLGRDAQAIKPRVPDRYAAAFERIEAGMSELASRIADSAEMREAANDSPAHAAPEQHAHAPSEDAGPDAYIFSKSKSFAEAPAPLRAHGEAPSPRHFSGVDTFDIIESDPPGNSDPWDRDTAEALTDIYETATTNFKSGAYSADFEQFARPHLQMPLAAHMSSHTAGASSQLDKPWLEERFAEITKRIEESLHDLRSDDGFFALNQRVDAFEQNLTHAIEGIATRGDVEGVHLIEAHVGELAGHLESVHNQLMRLDEIERHLSGIAAKLDDVHQAAALSLENSPADQAKAFDLDAVARTAAEAAAGEFAKIQPTAAGNEAIDTSELAVMLRDFIAESRQGDENTNALLDTLQQAMIRLLDRIDSMEMSAIHGGPHALTAAHELMSRAYGPEPVGSHRADDFENEAPAFAASDAQANDHGEPQSYADPSSDEDRHDEAHGRRYADTPAEDDETVGAEPPERSPERIRQEFIEEARRAKMRLSAEAEAEDVANEDSATPPPADTQQPISAAALRKRARASSVAPDASEENKKKEAAAGSSRLRIWLLAALLALGSFWATQHSGLLSDHGPVTAPIATTGGQAPATAPSASAAPASTESSGETGANDLKLPEGTRGDIVPGEFDVGSTSVPLYGVAVDTERPISAEGLERLRRQQAMAAVSTQLGEVVARNGNPAAIPAALHPDAASPEASSPSASTGPMSRSSALDLPPATVGPLSLRLAAANGDPSAEFEVGARLAEGKGTGQTFADAAKWYQRAASKGLAQAQYRLGTLYERGLGVKPDKARAEDWYRRAADQGNVKAMHNLAVLRANTTTGSPDYMNAALWFEKAAERGLSDSQFNLAVLKENGLGVPKDMVSAYKWLSLAAKSGDKEAIRRRDILKGKLTTDELADAERRIAEFRTTRSDPAVNDAIRAGEAWKKNSAGGYPG